MERRACTEKERFRAPLYSQLLGNESCVYPPPSPHSIIALSFPFQKPALDSAPVSSPSPVTFPESSRSLSSTSPTRTSPSGIPKRRTGKDATLPFQLPVFVPTWISAPGGHPHDSSDLSIVVESTAPPSAAYVTVGK